MKLEVNMETMVIDFLVKHWQIIVGFLLGLIWCVRLETRVSGLNAAEKADPVVRNSHFKLHKDNVILMISNVDNNLSLLRETVERNHTDILNRLPSKQIIIARETEIEKLSN